MIHPRVPQCAYQVAEHYDELDGVYRLIWGEHVHHGYWRTGRESSAEATEALTLLVAQRLGASSGQRLCDIGCGYGASAELMAARFNVDVTGLTLSGAQFALAQKRSPAAGSIQIVQRDWLDNGLPSDTFDGAYAIESSEHMVDKARFFTEAARVLRPGGKLVVCAWLASSAASRFQIRHLLEPICREGRLPSMGSREDYEALAVAGGLVPLSFQDISPKVRRTWSTCARRIAWKLLMDAEVRHLALDPDVSSRVFLLTIPRLMVALRTGAMRYGLFVWRKPVV